MDTLNPIQQLKREQKYRYDRIFYVIEREKKKKKKDVSKMFKIMKIWRDTNSL